MSWATRRKTTYLGTIILILVLILLAISYSLFYKKASCTDSIQNQGEAGIDCGGPCQNLCRASYVSPNLLWTAKSKIKSTGLYSVLAYLENPNIGVGSGPVGYDFRVYDKNRILLGEKVGKTTIPSNKNFAVFEDNLNLNDKVPVNVDFIFTEPIPWTKMQSKEESIVIVSKNSSNMDTKPRVDVVVKNTSLSTINNIELVGILYDSNDNAIAFSKTIIDQIAGQGQGTAVFTWPEPFGANVYRIEVVSKVLSPNN